MGRARRQHPEWRASAVACCSVRTWSVEGDVGVFSSDSSGGLDFPPEGLDVELRKTVNFRDSTTSF